MSRIRIAAALCAAGALIASSGAAQAEPAPIERGSIRIGPTLAAGCYHDPICTGFVRGCYPELAVRDGLMTSIVNVKDLQGQTVRYRADGEPLYEGAYATTSLEFRTAMCLRLSDAGYPRHQQGRESKITIPHLAEWLIVSAHDVRAIHWMVMDQH